MCLKRDTNFWQPTFPLRLYKIFVTITFWWFSLSRYLGQFGNFSDGENLGYFYTSIILKTETVHITGFRKPY